MYESSPIEFHQQHAQLREAIESCPSFLCGDVVVIHQKGTITWGHAADIFDMTRETAVRGNLFLFNNPQNETATCLQMDAGPINTSLYNMENRDFIQFLRTHILPIVFNWYESNYGYPALPDTTPLYITNENFELLDYDDPSA